MLHPWQHVVFRSHVPDVFHLLDQVTLYLPLCNNMETLIVLELDPSICEDDIGTFYGSKRYHVMYPRSKWLLAIHSKP